MIELDIIEGLGIALVDRSMTEDLIDYLAADLVIFGQDMGFALELVILDHAEPLIDGLGILNINIIQHADR